MITLVTLYFSRSFFAAFPFLRQSCSSLHSLLIEEKSIKNPPAGNIK